MAYCTNCGRKIHSKICDNCGERNNRIHKYCYWCGKPFLGPTPRCLECGERVRAGFRGILKRILFVVWFLLCCLYVAVSLILEQYISAVLFLLSGLVFLPALGRWIRKITYGRKGKRWIRWGIDMVRLFLGVTLFVYACVLVICIHEWVDATCDSPRYCSLCGETEGLPLEHNWRDATCDSPRECRWCHTTMGKPLKHEWEKATCKAPRTCRLCGAEEGNALEHTPGKITENMSIPKGMMIAEQRCTGCNTVLQSEEIPLTSFVRDDLFAFSPGAFMERLKIVAKDLGHDFRYEFDEVSGGLMADFCLDPEGEEKRGFINFFKGNGITVEPSERWKEGLWCVSMTVDGPAENFGYHIEEDLLRLIYMACDPTLGEEAYEEFQVMKLASALNTLQDGELSGYYKKNGLLYEFMHLNLGVRSMEDILVYPRDWREK